MAARGGRGPVPGVSAQLCGPVIPSQVQAPRPASRFPRQLSTAQLCLPGAARKPAEGRMGGTFRAAAAVRGPPGGHALGPGSQTRGPEELRGQQARVLPREAEARAGTAGGRERPNPNGSWPGPGGNMKGAVLEGEFLGVWSGRARGDSEGRGLGRRALEGAWSGRVGRDSRGVWSWKT